MIDKVLTDIKDDYQLLARSGFTTKSAMDALRNVVFKYVTTKQLVYADGVRLASATVFLLVTYRQKGESKNGMDS